MSERTGRRLESDLGDDTMEKPDSIFVGVAEPVTVTDLDVEMSKKPGGNADAKSRKKKKSDK